MRHYVPDNTPLKEIPFIGKVNYVMKYIMGDVLHDASTAVANGSCLGGLFVTLATVDYLAGYFVGRETRSSDYKAFMKRYYPTQYHPYLDSIYSQIRCGLLHNLVALNPWKGMNQVHFIIQDEHPMHLTDEDGVVSFSVPTFIKDTTRAFVMYQFDLIMKKDEFPNLEKNFLKRFNKLNGKASVMVRTQL